MLVTGACTAALPGEEESGATDARTITIKGPEKLRNGDVVEVTLDLGISGLSPVVDFSGLDSDFSPDKVSIEEKGSGVYVVRYTISATNTRTDGTYTVKIEVALGGGVLIKETWSANLSNKIPRAGTVDLKSQSSRISAFSQNDSVMGFGVNSTGDDMTFEGVEVVAEGADAAAMAGITKVSLYEDKDGDGKVGASDVLVAEGTPRPDGEKDFTIELKPKEKKRLGKGTAQFIVTVDASCSSTGLSDKKLKLKIPADKFHLRGANNTTPDLGGGFPLEVEVDAGSPFEKLWETTLGMLPPSVDWGAGTDVNGDGTEELLLLSSASSYLYVLRSPAFTGVETAGRYDLGVAGMADAVFADIDADGTMDVVASSEHGRGVVVALSGRDYAPQVFALRSRPTPLTLARGFTDVGGDGKWDLIALDPRRATIVTGKGEFDADRRLTLTLASEIETELVSVTGFAAADVTGDRASDVILATSDLLEGRIWIYHAPKKDGRYELLNSQGGLPRIDLMRAGDLNGDGLVEIVIANAQGVLQVLEASAEGQLTTTISKGGLETPTRLELVDIDSEVTDIVTLEKDGALVRALMMNGSARVGSERLTSLTEASGGSVAKGLNFVFSDLNGDLTRDLVVSEESRLTAFRVAGTSVSLRFRTEADPTPGGVALLSRAGRVRQVVVPDATNKKVYVYNVGPQGSLGSVAKILDTSSAGLAVRSGVFGGGLTEDLALLLDGGSIQILNGEDLSVATTLSPGAGTGLLRSLDIDLDGRMDLTTTQADAGTAAYFLASAGGAFTKHSLSLLPGPEDLIMSVDVNEDGKADAISTHPTGKLMAWAAGDPTTGVYGSPTSVRLKGVPSMLASGDVLGDGRPEVVVGLTNGLVEIFRVRNDAEGLRLARSVDLGGEVSNLVIEDFDVDGKPDVLGIVGPGEGRSHATAFFLKSLGGGEFCAPSKTRAPAGQAEIALGDLNGDGSTDVVVVTAEKRLQAWMNTLLE